MPGQFVTIRARLRIGDGRAREQDVRRDLCDAQLFADVELVAKLPRECFWPQPEVASAMVSIAPGCRLMMMLIASCLHVSVSSFFNQRRKQLGRVKG